MLGILSCVLQAATKVSEQTTLATGGNPLSKSYDTLLQYGAIGACLVIFIILFIYGMKRQERLHKEVVDMVRADTATTASAYQEMLKQRDRTEDKYEKLLERYHNDLTEMNTTLELALSKLSK